MPRRKRTEREGREGPGAAAAPPGPGPEGAPARTLASRARLLAGTRWFLPAALAALTLGVWARTFAVPVVEWDDDTYIFRDVRLAELSAANVRRILTEPYFANYHPVTTLTYALDLAVYGRWAPGYHATQLAFYVAGVLVLYYLFRAILGSAGAAFAAAAVYSVHAIHVEPVAWLAQRKDVVCLAFYAGAVLAYVRYAREREKPWRFYAAAVALAALAMLSKGYAVVLPGVLVAYDLCFAGRRKGEALWGVGWRRVWDKLPFVALAVAVTAFTFLSQGKDSALVRESIPLGMRLTALGQVFAAYVGRSLLPVALCAKYVVKAGTLNVWLALVGVTLAAGMLASFVLLRRRVPAAAFGIALFMLPLATVMNTFWTLMIWQTDRYLFFPTIGTSLALAAVGLRLPATIKKHTDLARLASALRAGPVTWLEVAVAPRLALRAVDGGCRVEDLPAQLVAQEVLLAAGRREDLAARYERRREEGVADPVLRYLMARLEPDAGKRIGPLKAAARAMPESPWPALDLSNAYAAVGDWRKARENAALAAERAPGMPEAWHLLGVAEARLGDVDAARGHLERALKADPGFSEAREALDRLARPDAEGAGASDVPRVDVARAAAREIKSTDRPRRLAAGLVAASAALVVVLYATLAVVRIGVWTDPVLLWSDTVRKQMGLGGSGPLTADGLRKAVRRAGRKITIADTQAYDALADAFRRAGREEEARALVGGLSKEGTGETGVDISLARREIARGSFDEAVRLLGPTIEGGGWLAPIALTVTGDALSRKGDAEGARAAYRRSLDIFRASGRPGTEAIFGLASLDYKAWRFAEAAEGYRRVLEAAPESAHAKLFLGASLCEIGRAEEGYALYEQALALAGGSPAAPPGAPPKPAGKAADERPGPPADTPRLADIHKMMGKAAHEKLGRPADAVRHFEEVLRLVPDHPEKAAIEFIIREQRRLMERGK